MRFETCLEVDLDKFTQNIIDIQKIVDPHNLLVMVKANAYGHGLVPMSRHLFNELEVNQVGCASLGEAVEIKKNIKSLEKKIYVFSDTNLFHYSNLYKTNSTFLPVIGTLEELEFFLCSKEFSLTPLVIKVDTGMNRLGIDYKKFERIIALLKKFKRNEVFHLMSHFSSSYLKKGNHPSTINQQQNFEKIKRELSNHSITVLHSSLSNSGVIENRINDENNDIFRIGLMAYGLNSSTNHEIKMQVISSLKTKVIKKIFLKKNDCIGYGATKLIEDKTIYYLPLGYGDGLLTFYSGAKVKINNKKAEICGRVNMDLVAISFNQEDDPNLSVGEQINLWEFDDENINSLANHSGTSPYQILCALNNRIPRHYRIK